MPMFRRARMREGGKPLPLKVSKSQKQNTKFGHTPKNQRNFVHFFALASKKWLKQKIKTFDDLN